MKRKTPAPPTRWPDTGRYAGPRLVRAACEPGQARPFNLRFASCAEYLSSRDPSGIPPDLKRLRYDRASRCGIFASRRKDYSHSEGFTNRIENVTRQAS